MPRVKVQLCALCFFRWSIGQKVEVRDKDCVSQLRVGYVKRRKGGRILVCYWDSRGKAKGKVSLLQLNNILA